MKHTVIIAIELETLEDEEIQHAAQHLATGLGDSEESLVTNLAICDPEDGVVLSIVKKQDLHSAAEEADVVPEQILQRLHSMYESNLYEDLKWVVQDIHECGAD